MQLQISSRCGQDLYAVMQQHPDTLRPCSMFNSKLTEFAFVRYRALSSSGSVCTLLRKEKLARRTAMMPKASKMTVIMNMSSGLLDCDATPACNACSVALIIESWKTPLLLSTCVLSLMSIYRNV